MSTIAWLALIALIATLAVIAGGWLLWRHGADEDRRLIERIGRLAFRAKLRLAWALFGDRRIPLLVRAIPPALVLYLGMPLDIVPDFIPVLGQLDDVVVVVIGVGLLFRFSPRSVIEFHLAALEAAADTQSKDG